jgi:hypothetical protein
MAQGTWGSGLGSTIFRCNIQFQHSGQKCQTGFHLRDVGVAGQSPADVADAVADWATTQFIKCLHTSGRLTGIDVQNLLTNTGHSISPSNLAGTQGGVVAPGFLTVPVSLKGELRKRYGSGRMLWPVPNVDSVEGNIVTPAMVTFYDTVITDLVDRFIGNAITTDLQLCHAHKAMPANGDRPALPASWYDVTSVRLNTSVSSLKRRKAGVGS